MAGRGARLGRRGTPGSRAAQGPAGEAADGAFDYGRPVRGGADVACVRW
ncbi:hypothetical protein ACFV4N_37445 [Actinosynnema sp. NPDC059797]